MKTISLHGVEATLHKKIAEQAHHMGYSINRTVKSLLENSLGLSTDMKKEGRFNDLCGVWSEKETAEFRRKTENFNKIDMEDWK